MKKIMLVGAPASGKTTVGQVVKEVLHGKGMEYREINDYLVQLELCPKEVKSEKYYYDSGNSLVFADEYREELINNLFERLALEWKKRSDGVTILEFTTPDWEVMIEKYFGKVDDTLLVFVGSDPVLRRERNANRIGQVIPKAYMDMFTGDGEKDFEKIKDKFSEAIYLQNNSTRDSFLEKAFEKLLKVSW